MHIGVCLCISFVMDSELGSRSLLCSRRIKLTIPLSMYVPVSSPYCVRCQICTSLSSGALAVKALE